MSSRDPSTPRGRATLEEFDKIVRSLNDNYGLDLHPLDHTLSPSKRRSMLQTDEQEQCYRIYKSLHRHHFGRPGRLATYLGQFASKAAQLSKQWVDKPDGDPDTLPPISAPLGARCAEERAALRDLLQGILDGPMGDLRLQRKQTCKRISDEYDSDEFRRTRSRFNAESTPKGDSYNAIDAIPLRSKKQLAHEDPVATTNDFAGLSNLSRSTANSSRTSIHSTVFSEQAPEDTLASSQSTSYDTAKFPREPFAVHSQESFAPCTQECRALDEPFSKFDDDDSCSTPKQSKTVNGETLFQDASEYSETDYPVDRERRQRKNSAFSTLPDMTEEEESRLFDGHNLFETGPAALEQRLKNTWPLLPERGWNDAPLAVMWEVTRAAAHCGVNLRSLDMKYDPNFSNWYDQQLLRGRLSNNPLFIGKGLPPRSEPAPWAAATGGFQSKEKVVVLSADLTYRPDESGPLFQIKLNPLQLRSGHRLDRRFGADRFLEVTMPPPTSVDQQPSAVKRDPAASDKIIRWLCQETHYFLGRTWVPFFTRSTKKAVSVATDPNDPYGSRTTRDVFLEQVIFFATDGDNFRSPDTLGDFPSTEEAGNPQLRTKLGYTGLLQWAINIKSSAQQPVLKLFSRIALSLSRTQPSVVLEQHQIRHRDTDLMSMPDQQEKRKEMNDGIGQMSRSLAKKIASSLGLADTPSAFQGRLGSAKGMWIIDVKDDGLNDDDWIETYPSQRKWDCDFEDRHHRMFEVKNIPRPLKSASLNQQFIPVLETQSWHPHNMRRAIASHLENGLRVEFEDQRAALEHPLDLRLQMQNSGFSSYERLFHGHVPFLGGLPESDEDKIAFLLDSGFNAKNLRFLWDIVWDLANRKAKTLENKMNIKIPCSTYAYMVTDFVGLLEPGEVHFSFSSNFSVDGFSDTLLEGMEILVARAPAHFPSDIQKVRVVSKPHLRQLKDVIVFPTKGTSPLADLLSGGDYDGDTAWVCWDQDIVKNFRNAGPPPEFDFVTEGYLKKQTGRFHDLLYQSGNIDVACQSFRYIGMSFSMQQSLLGRCTKYKERLCYHRDGVNSDQAITLSALLSNLVDQAKAGITFTNNDWLRFRLDRLKRQQKYDDPEYTKEKPSDSWSRKSEHHILDYLKFTVAKDLTFKSLQDLWSTRDSAEWFDGDLTRLYREFEERAKSSNSHKMLMDHLRAAIQALLGEWRNTMGLDRGIEADFETKVNSIYQKWIEIEPPQHLRKTRLLNQLKDVWSHSHGSNATYSPALSKDDWSAPFSPWMLLKASTTFRLSYSRGSKFAWYMAGRQLATMKGRIVSSSPQFCDTSPVFVVPEMYAALRSDKKFITARAARRGQAAESDSISALDEVAQFDDYGVAIDDV